MVEKVVQGVSETGVIAIVRGFRPAECVRLAEAYLEGGVRVMEITFDQRSAERRRETCSAIREISDRFAGRMTIGAGTVLTVEQLKAASDAGAKFVVMPNVDHEIIRASAERGLASIPGAFTPTEIVAAFKAGATFVKLFPAFKLGADYVKSIRAPLSHIPLVAVGGLMPSDVGAYVKAGCVGVGVGANMVNREWVDRGAWNLISAAAAEYVSAVNRARSAQGD